MPTQSYARLDLEYPRDQVMDESALRAQLKALGFTVAQLSYRLTDSGARFEYRMMLRTSRPENFEKLAHSLRTEVPVVEFRISPPATEHSSKFGCGGKAAPGLAWQAS